MPDHRPWKKLLPFPPRRALWCHLPWGELVESGSELDGWEMNPPYVDKVKFFIDRARERQETVNALGGDVASLTAAISWPEGGVA